VRAALAHRRAGARVERRRSSSPVGARRPPLLAPWIGNRAEHRQRRTAVGLGAGGGGQRAWSPRLRRGTPRRSPAGDPSRADVFTRRDPVPGRLAIRGAVVLVVGPFPSEGPSSGGPFNRTSRRPRLGPLRRRA